MGKPLHLLIVEDCQDDALPVARHLRQAGTEGVETISGLRREHPGLRIIATSGGSRLGASDLLERARQAGADRTIPKPFEPEELLSSVREASAPAREVGRVHVMPSVNIGRPWGA